MRTRRTVRCSAPLVGAALVTLLLPWPSAAIAGKAPSLASTAQYRAFVDYVKKLDGLVGQPTTTAQKGIYETELTAKKEAAAHKANALFNRSSEEALADSEAKFKEQAAAIRSAEAADLEALTAEFGAKRERAEASYHGKLEKIASGGRKFEARTHEQIDALRAQKAQTRDVAGKTAIQEQITNLGDEIEAKRKEGSEKRAKLKAGYRKQKAEIQSGEEKKEGKVKTAAEEKIAKSSKHWKGAYDAQKAGLNGKRESQLAYLNAKLEKGRADIATMPAAG
jgi:hypothetical protein